MIYVGSPVGFITGGPMLAHQLCRELIDNGIDAKMYYHKRDSIVASWDDIGNSPYARYGVDAARSLDEIDREGNVVLLSEIAIPFRKAFHRAKVHIWWMSVNNYLYHLVGYEDRLSEEIPFFTSPDVYHFVQSRYAYDFLIKDMMVAENQIAYLTDYTNEKYLEKSIKNSFDKTERDNTVYYNYKKKGEELPKIMESNPHINWKPIKDMTEDQVIDAFHHGKIYIDLGTHPGKDRLPREAAICGLCVITNMVGAAANEEDIPIPKEYKFSAPLDQSKEIVNLIEDIFKNFDKRSKDFDNYRDIIRGEKARFSKEAVNAVKMMYGGANVR